MVAQYFVFRISYNCENPEKLIQMKLIHWTLAKASNFLIANISGCMVCTASQSGMALTREVQ